MALSFVVTGTIWAWILNPTSGINVLIEGTQLGAATDPDGEYIIIGVRPGTSEATRVRRATSVMIRPAVAPVVAGIAPQ